RTFGCQMNMHDSNRVEGLLLKKGYSIVEKPGDADILIFNTCSVRKNAEDRVFGVVGSLKRLKKKRKGLIFGIMGCMAEAKKEEIFERLEHVDFICGPANLDMVPDIIERLRANPGRIVQIGGFKSKRIPDFTLGNCAGHGIDTEYVKIIEGCSNFCSYCIVPYVRGPERSRPSKDIVKEVKRLLDKGVKKIMLLGQNVNSYGKGLKENIDFVRLLQKIDKLIFKSYPQCRGALRLPYYDNDNDSDGDGNDIGVNFATSHPKDANTELFKAMAGLKSIVKNLHLPLQSGSDKILKFMNRGYSYKHYKSLIDSYRKIVKGGGLTTDLIIGFPGETEKDFKDTLKAVKEIKFDAAYIFKYSPRSGTKAALLEDDVPQEEKERRHKILLETQKEISLRKKNG
ncbi:MAG: tRNA (N6-isopentenyl adenosine(37)-C2)-methylthiotransferase MiaB, partial [Candidatus Omnitrophota bacterium]